MDLRIQSAIERAGGTAVWVKSGKRNERRGSSAGESGGSIREVLAASTRFDGVVASVEHLGEAEKTPAKIERSGWPGGGREVLFTWKLGAQERAEWRIREVPKLLRASIVIDDLGQDLDAAHHLIDEPYPLTFSVLPGLVHSAQTAREAHAAGREVMLHLPMQPEELSTAHAGPGAILVGMKADEVARTIQEDLGSVPFAVGVNNHMGSRATKDSALMEKVMRVLSERRLFFVDSRTTANSEALQEARSLGLPAFYRSVFLDDQETVAYTLEELRAFRRAVEKQGEALAIGHPHSTTLKALGEFLPEFERANIQLVSASQLVSLPEAARLNPPAAPSTPKRASH